MDRLNGIPVDECSSAFNAQHLGDGGTVEVQIEQADVFTMVRKGECEVYRNGGFSNSALPAEYENDALFLDRSVSSERPAG